LHHVLLGLSVDELSLQALDLLSALLNLSLLSQSLYLFMFDLGGGSSPLASSLQHIGSGSFAHYISSSSIRKYALNQ
jgi:hypothetical protein